MKNEKTSLIRSDGFQTLLASLICILGGILVGYIALLIIEPSGAFEAIIAVLKSFFRYPGKLMLKYFGQTLVRTVPLLMCALSVLFANKAGLFNIGAAGQYVVGAGACLYMALALNLPWWACLICAMIAGAVLGAVATGAFETIQDAAAHMCRIAPAVLPNPEKKAIYDRKYQMFLQVIQALDSVWDSMQALIDQSRGD